MPIFRYTAQSISTNEIISDEIEIADQDRIADHLYFKGYTLLDVEEITPGFLSKLKFRIKTVRLKDLLLFTRQFYTLIKAGIPLFKSLDIVILQTQNNTLRDVCEMIRDDLLEGSSFSDSLKNYPHIFPDFYISMVSVGEAKGNLDESLENISTYLSKKRELQNKIITALIYPAILIGSGITVVILMVAFVLPRFVTVFVQNEIKMPFFTEMLLVISNFLTSYYFVILFGIIVLFISTVYAYQTTRGRYLIDQFLIKIPVLGIVFYNVSVTRFARVLGILYGSGIPLIKSIEIAGESMNNHFLNSFVVGSLSSVRDGKGVAVPLRDSGQFPSIVVEMIGTGEETGTLDKLSVEAADFMDSETEYKIKRLVSMIEPLALIVIGIMVAIIASSFLLPIFKLASSIRH